MKSEISLILVFFFSVVGFSYADSNIEISLQTDKKEISLQENLELKINIKQKGNNDINIGNLSLSGIENFSILGQSSSTSMEVINNDTKLLSSVVYYLQAKNVGNFTLGPASVEIGTGKYETNTISVKVIDSNITETNILNNTSKQENSINYVLLGIILFLVLFIIGLFLNYRKYIKNSPEIKINKLEKFSFEIDLNDEHFENKIDSFIRQYIDIKYNKNILSYTYKEIYEMLINNNFPKENLIIIDKIFSYLIINKYNREKMGNREEILKNINILEI